MLELAAATRPTHPSAAVRRGLGALAAALLCLAPARAVENVAIEPAALSRVPATGLGTGQYWQQLRITLQATHEASEPLVTVSLPHGTMVPDTDGDGLVADEVRLVYQGVAGEDAGCRMAATSTATALVVASRARAEGGSRVYLQFPLGLTASPAGAALPYGPVTFAQPGETDLSEGPTLYVVTEEEYRALHSMGLVTLGPALADAADTLTSAVGTYYPDEAALLVEGAPDLVYDGGSGTYSNLLPAGGTTGDGRDDNDVPYRFVWSAEPDLTRLAAAPVYEATVGIGGDEQTLRVLEGGMAQLRLVTRGLPASTYHLYAVTSLTGDLPVARSRAIVVQHDPAVLFVGPRSADIVLDSGGLLDTTGAATLAGTRRYTVPFAAVDHDDVASVRLFYSPQAGLGPADLQPDSSDVASLSGAVPMAGQGTLSEADSAFAWDVAAPQLVPAGDYYVYAVATGGGALAVARSAYRVRVRHSPLLELDALHDQLPGSADTIVTGGARPQRYITLTWGRSTLDGDGDPDDDARISLYCSTLPAAAARTAGLALPTGAQALLDEVGQRAWAIAAGIAEDPDGREADQQVWDLWQVAGDGWVPRAGVVHYVYGLIEDGTSRRLVQLNGGRANDAASRLVFLHPPTARVLQPAATTVLGQGNTGRVVWEDEDLDDDARLRVLLTPQDHGQLSTYAAVATPEAVAASGAGGSAPDPAVTQADLSEDSPVDYLDIPPADLGLGAGTYYVYVAITDSSYFGPQTLAWRAPGVFQVQAGEAPGPAPTVALVPDVFAVGSGGGQQRLEVRVSDSGEAVDLVRVALRLEPGSFGVADQDTLAPGVQPFAAAPGFSAARLVTNQVEFAADGGRRLLLEYFEPTAERIAGLDGRAALVTTELVATGPEGPTQISLAGDAQGAGLSHLDRDGVLLVRPEPGPLAVGTIVPGRATLRGQLSLEGRTAMAAMVDASLWPWSRYGDWVDTAFVAANDRDPERPGVQIAVGADGVFELTSLPTGRLDLRLHCDGYLDAGVPGLDLYAAQVQEGITPSTPGSARDGWLLGGDVAGSVDLQGVGPDNEVTLADWDYVAAYFGLPADDALRRRADITADGTVDIDDLSLVGANYGTRGPMPVYKRAAGGAPAELDLRRAPVADAPGEVVLTLAGQGLDAVRAFQVRLAAATADWAVVQEWVGGEGALVAREQDAAGWTLAGVLPGRERDFGAQADLARWRLRPRRVGAAWPELGPAVLVDRADAHVPVVAAASGPPLPGLLGLEPNYPNPFNPGTTVPVTVPVGAGAARIVLEVYDLLGQRVAVLWDGPLSPGRYLLRWDGCDAQGRPAASGLYLCRLLGADAAVRVQRLVLVR